MDLDEVDQAFRQSPLITELEEVAKSGDFSSFDSEAKRQHFVPRFLLGRFAEKVGRKKFIYQLDTETGDARRVETKDAAAKRYFYALLDDEGNRNNRIEGFLSRVESHAANALREFLADPFALAPGDRATLSLFFALQDVRTPVSTERSAQASETIMRLLLSAQFTDRELFAERYQHLFGETEAAEIEERRKELLAGLEDGSVGYADPKAQGLDAGFGAAGQLAYVIYAMDWRLLLRDQAFITSDRGLAMYDPDLTYPFSSQSWWSSAKSETTIPLSSDVCLLIRPLPTAIDTQEIDETGARAINRRTFSWADGYIFGRTEELVVAVHQEAEKNPDKVIKPRPKNQVLLIERDESDTSFADANEARGWPRYLADNGVEHDYAVIPHGAESLELAAEVNKKVEERARRKLGIPDGEPMPGGAAIDLIDPRGLW